MQRDDAFVLWDDIQMDTDEREKEEASPEWVRRTVCCAKWEVDEAKKASSEASTDGSSSKVLLAILHPPISNGTNPPSATSHHALRAGGALVAYWAQRAGVGLMQVTPNAPGVGAKGDDDKEKDGDERRGKRQPDGSSRGHPGGIAPTKSVGGSGNVKAGIHGSSKRGSKKGLVERPAALMAMMEPGRPVVRVLARGEKLEIGS